MGIKYDLEQRKYGVLVTENGQHCALVDEETAIKYGYKSAMEYCECVFQEKPRKD